MSSIYNDIRISHQIDPLEAVEADYHSIHSGLGEDLKRTVKGVLPSERKRRRLEPTLDDYPNHRQWNVNVGNTNAEELVKWLNQYRPDLIAPTVDMEGMWEGEREPSGQAQVINATRDEIEDMLNAYGYEHPAEEAIGVMPVGEGRANSILWQNPYNSPQIDLTPPPSPYKKLELPR